jgi:hypothetical protein
MLTYSAEIIALLIGIIVMLTMFIPNTTQIFYYSRDKRFRLCSKCKRMYAKDRKSWRECGETHISQPCKCLINQ